jgi:hypothetical protein
MSLARINVLAWEHVDLGRGYSQQNYKLGERVTLEHTIQCELG